MNKPTPQSCLRRYLVLELYEAGGKASLSDMKRAMRKHLWEGKEAADMGERTTGGKKRGGTMCVGNGTNLKMRAIFASILSVAYGSFQIKGSNLPKNTLQILYLPLTTFRRILIPTVN